MPMVRFMCNNDKCNKILDKMYRKTSDIPDDIACEKCSKGTLERQLGAPSSKGVQVIDNGVQSQKTVVMNDVIENEREKLYNGEE